jgi:hypothetical protein
VTWSKRMKDWLLGLLVVVALVGAFFVATGVLSLLRQASCDRLDDARLEHLEPGHDTPGPGSTYVKGVGPGPPPSQLFEYLEAAAEMQRAGCDVPGETGPGVD